MAGQPNAEDTTRCPRDPQGEPMDADSELKPSGDGPTAARDDVAPARARGKQLRERLARALLSAQMSKSIPEAVAREILALNSAVLMKDQSIGDILRLALESHNVGYLDREKTISVVGAYLAAQKILEDMLIRLGAGPGDLEIAQAAICVATSISIQAGSASPRQTSKLKRFLMQKQVANSRAKKASKKLSPSCVDQVIIACFADQSLTKGKGCKTTSQRAVCVLDAVNNRLSALAADSSVTRTRYSSADNLRRRFDQAKKRTAN
jgi:hypothetical protein